MATLAQAISSASSTASSGQRGSRSEAKKAVSAYAKQLAEAVSVLPYLEELTRSIKRGEQIRITLTGATGQPEVISYTLAVGLYLCCSSIRIDFALSAKSFMLS